MNPELKRFLDVHIQNDTDIKTATVFPLPCGIGKSEYIKYLIADALINDYGLIIITDAIDRLNGYTFAQDEHLTEYIKRNLNRISILSNESIAEEMRVLNRKPIILMSTQRYFNLTRDEIINLTTCQTYQRNKIVFDEKPYILVAYKITIDMLNNIDTALKQALDDTINQNNKQKLIKSWQIINSKLQCALENNEQKNMNYKRELYFNSESLKNDEDVKSFFTLVKKYKTQLTKFKYDVVKDIEAVNQLLTEGVITSKKVKVKKSGEEYAKYFTVVINNTSKLIDVGAKVFILDGTANISPEYMLKCFNIIDCSHFERNLSKLTINIVDINTSKDKLTRGGEKTDDLIKTIIDYIKSLPQNIDTVFTYKAITNKFTNDFTNVNWFGNIKGTNQLRNVNDICQIGLHRYSDLIYMLYANTISQSNKKDQSFTQIVCEKQMIDDIRCRLILADIDQNLFRCKIRNIDNVEPCTYTLMCNIAEINKIFDDYQPLVDMIISRYEKMGATVNIVDTPLQFKLLKTMKRKVNQKTNAQKILNWLSKKEKGYIFKLSDMLIELNLTNKQFDKIKKNNIFIVKLFNAMKTEKKGYYKLIPPYSLYNYI